MKAKRFTLILLACLLTLSVISCGENTDVSENVPTDTSAETVAETTAETEPEDTGYKADYLPNVTYDGYKFRIVGYEEYPKDIAEPSGEIVDNAIYTRNLLVEEKYDIEVVVTDIPFNDYLEITEMMTNAAMAQTDDYDLYVMVLKDAYEAVLKGYAPTMDELTYADMSQPWYYQSMNEKFTFDGISLVGVTAYDLNPGGKCMVFNKDMINKLSMESPYDMVNTGTWTLENLYSMSAAAIEDLNGDGKFKLDEDRFGMIGEPDVITTLMYAGSGMTLVEEVDGKLSVSQNEKLLDLFFLYLNNTAQDGIIFDPFVEIAWEENSRARGNEFFTRDGALFLVRSTDDLVTFGNMESDYGIVPYPKADQQQEEYYTPLTGADIAMACSSSADLARVSVIREALAVESLNLCHPAYYENSLQKRYVRDPESVEMMKLITANPVLDLGNSIWWDSVREPWLQCVMNRRDSIVSAITAGLPKSEKAIQDLLDKVEELKK